jgi:hypothetical protein
MVFAHKPPEFGCELEHKLTSTKTDVKPEVRWGPFSSKLCWGFGNIVSQETATLIIYPTAIVTWAFIAIDAKYWSWDRGADAGRGREGHRRIPREDRRPRQQGPAKSPPPRLRRQPAKKPMPRPFCYRPARRSPGLIGTSSARVPRATDLEHSSARVISISTRWYCLVPATGECLTLS